MPYSYETRKQSMDRVQPLIPVVNLFEVDGIVECCMTFNELLCVDNLG